MDFGVDPERDEIPFEFGRCVLADALLLAETYQSGRKWPFIKNVSNMGQLRICPPKRKTNLLISV